MEVERHGRVRDEVHLLEASAAVDWVENVRNVLAMALELRVICLQSESLEGVVEVAVVQVDPRSAAHVHWRS